MKVLASALGGVTDKSRSNRAEWVDTVLKFPWGNRDLSRDRELAYLRYVVNLPQPQRGTALMRLLALKPYLPRTSLTRLFGRLLPYSRMHLEGYTKPTEPRQTGMPYTTHTLFSTRKRSRRVMWDYSTP